MESIVCANCGDRFVGRSDPPSRYCSLDCRTDVAMTLDDIAHTMGLTRERIRQIEAGALLRLRKHGINMGDFR